MEEEEEEEEITGDSDVVTEDETTHGGDDTCHGDVRSEVTGICFFAISDDKSDCWHFFIIFFTTMNNYVFQTAIACKSASFYRRH